MKKNRLEKLEAVRGFAALYVVFFHTLPQKIYLGGINIGALFRFGPEAVIVFFALSGFVIKYTYERSKDKSFRYYFIRRFIRLYIPLLFIFLLAAAAGALIGGIVGDRIGRQRIIWISVLGPLPLTLILPHVDLFWTGVLTVLINLIMASAFASILIYAMELMPNRIGLIGGLFYGLNFGLAGIAAAILGGLADNIGIEAVYWLCSFLPLAGLLTWFLPKIEDTPRSKAE